MNKKAIIKTLIIIFAIFLPSFLVIVGFWLFFRTNIVRKQPEEMAKEEVKFLKPSQVLENKAKYKDEKLTIRGKVSQEPMVCERKECPKEDACCGCKQERNLVIADAERVVVKESVWRLRLLAPADKAFCQRKPNSCDYDCPGWKVGSIYDVTGTFFAEPPPTGSGWRMYFDFYFEVEEKNLVEKASIFDIPKRFFKGIQELIEQLGSSGYYVIQ